MQTRGEKIFKMFHFPTLMQISHLYPHTCTPGSRIKVALPVPVALVSRIFSVGGVVVDNNDAYCNVEHSPDAVVSTLWANMVSGHISKILF